MIRAILDRAPAPALALPAAFGVAYLGGAELGHALTFQDEAQVFAAFWPPAGLFLGTLALTDPRRWGRFIAAAFVANLASNMLFHDKSLWVSLGFFLANALEAALGAWLLRRALGPTITLGSLKEVSGVALLSAVASPAVGATVGAATVALAFDGTPFWVAWKLWWFADGVGVLVVAPVVLTWGAVQEGPPALWRPGRWAEVVAIYSGLAAVSFAVYGESLPGPLRAPILVLPFLLWAGLRLGPRGGATAIVVVAVIGLWMTSRGSGPFAALSSGPMERAFRAQATLGVVSLCVLFLAAAVSERDRAEKERLALIAELQVALAEIKTLRGLLPICSWCKRVRDDKDFWHTVEDYVVAHTEARFTHGMCPVCYEKAMAEFHRGEA